MEKERKASKENRGVLIIASIVLIVLLFTGAGGYTYARYATKEQGKGNAQIAKWAFEIEKGQEEMKKVKLVNTAQKDTLVNGKIAPGTSGSFSITLSAKNSEVGVKYTLSFLNEKNKPTNIKFKYNEKTYSSLKEIGEIVGNISLGTIRTAVIQIQWEWPYQTGTTKELIGQNDIIDTKESTSLSEYTFDILAIGTQIK